MDFIVLYSLIGTALLFYVFSYDIMCQWWCNLHKRLPQFPAKMRITQGQLDSARCVIPKFHIYGHGLSCQGKFSLNFLRYSAMTDGEDPERFWAAMNPLSMSTKEMGPGARVDTIEDHMASWNWRKITGLCQCSTRCSLLGLMLIISC